jgi:alkaline phosphatase
MAQMESPPRGGFYVDSATDLAGAGAAPKLLGLFGYGNMNVALDKIAKRRDPGGHGVVDDYHAPDQPMLEEMTDVALRVLAHERDGFVLMVEGAHIDKQAHLMDADRVIDETIEFDNAVAVAANFARRHGDTLVLVLADHECAGFSLIGALTGGISNLTELPDDSGVTNPATQPARQKVVGVYDAAGFPRYEIASDGYPTTFDVDGKVLVGFGADGDRYEGWLSKPHRASRPWTGPRELWPGPVPRDRGAVGPGGSGEESSLPAPAVLRRPRRIRSSSCRRRSCSRSALASARSFTSATKRRVRVGATPRRPSLAPDGWP